jgi:putative addiction module component (TIGR02574 family)
MTTLSPDLIATLKNLSPDERDLVRDLLDEQDGPPESRTAREQMDEIQRRAAKVASGNYTSLTREESTEQIREAIRKLGHEL